MDHLSQVAKAARECGVSYGKYVAMQYEQRGYKPERKQEDYEPAMFDSDNRRCVICGGFLPFGAVRHQTTCSAECSAERNRRHSRERYRANVKFNPEALMKCEHCGKEFYRRQRNQRFCCRQCNEDYRYEQVGKLKGRNGMKDRNYGTATCAACGVEYLKRSPAQKTCSRSCYNRMRREQKRKDKKC